MSKYKVGEKWVTSSSDLRRDITWVGRGFILVIDEWSNPHLFREDFPGEHDNEPWTKTHEADGSPVSDVCWASDGDNRCTLEKGHSGRHADCSTPQVRVTWRDDEFGGEVRHEIDWSERAGCVHAGLRCGPMSTVQTRMDFIAYEFEDGYRSRVSPTLLIDAMGNYTTGETKTHRGVKGRVRAVAVILSSKEGE